MGIFEDVLNKIQQILQISSSAYVYKEQCSKISAFLNEIKSKLTKDQKYRTKDDKINPILIPLNQLFDIVNTFQFENWAKISFSVNILDPILQITANLNSISELLKKLNITIETDYTSDQQKIFKYNNLSIT